MNVLDIISNVWKILQLFQKNEQTGRAWEFLSGKQMHLWDIQEFSSDIYALA